MAAVQPPLTLVSPATSHVATKQRDSKEINLTLSRINRVRITSISSRGAQRRQLHACYTSTSGIDPEPDDSQALRTDVQFCAVASSRTQW